MILQDRHKRRDKALVVHPNITAKTIKADSAVRSLSRIIDEASGLAEAIDLEILDAFSVTLKKIDPGAFFSRGHKDSIASMVEERKPDVVIVNHELSPVQQRNLEKTWKAKVIDRTGLILEIFGARAQTKEGRLQVELAALEYQKSRLVRSWTHLERQRGGAGFMGGPGETQIELDRRIISDRILKLKKDLEQVRRTRQLARKSRERVPFPVVALVGYTNAGKSTLFNALTKADVLAEDMLFATLDPTMRRIDLGGGQKIILSDTVGFISDLPTHLVASFRATLEQIDQADIILHVIDVSSDDYQAQRLDVIKVLGDLGIEYDQDQRIIEVWNKCDSLDEEKREDIARKARFDPRVIIISALRKDGLQECLAAISKGLGRNRKSVQFEIPVEDGRAVAWLYEHCDVLGRTDYDAFIRISVMIEPGTLNIFQSKYNYPAQD